MSYDGENLYINLNEKTESIKMTLNYSAINKINIGSGDINSIDYNKFNFGYIENITIQDYGSQQFILSRNKNKTRYGSNRYK